MQAAFHCLLVGLAFVRLSVSLPVKNQTIFLLQEDISAYSLNCQSHQLVALSADGMSLLFYDIEKQELAMTKDLPLPGQLIKSSEDGKLHVITHDSYVTIVKDDTPKTYPVASIKSTTIVIVENLVCVTPSEGDTNPAFLCFNVHNTSDQWHSCGYSNYDTSEAYVDVPKGWVYVGTGDEAQKYKASRNKDCLESANNGFSTHSPKYGESPMWFSYDGSRIFLNDGSTLTASNDKSDLTHRGDFNASYNTYSYNYFSQSHVDPYNIAGIRADINDTIYYYGWPYLMPQPNKQLIYLAPQAVDVGAEEVHVCDTLLLEATYVVVKYVYIAGNTKTGVVTLKN